MASNLFTNKKKMLGEGDGKISYKTPLGGKVTMDTTGFATGAKKFPIKVEGEKIGLYGKSKPATSYGFANRKGAERAIANSQGKKTKKYGFNPSGKAKKAFEDKASEMQKYGIENKKRIMIESGKRAAKEGAAEVLQERATNDILKRKS